MHGGFYFQQTNAFPQRAAEQRRDQRFHAWRINHGTITCIHGELLGWAMRAIDAGKSIFLLVTSTDVWPLLQSGHSVAMRIFASVIYMAPALQLRSN